MLQPPHPCGDRAARGGRATGRHRVGDPRRDRHHPRRDLRTLPVARAGLLCDVPVGASAAAVAEAWLATEHRAYQRPEPNSLTRQGREAAATRLTRVFVLHHHAPCPAAQVGETAGAWLLPCTDELPLTGELLALWRVPLAGGAPGRQLARPLRRPRRHPPRPRSKEAHPVIHIAETVGVGSIENFLDPAERLHLATLMTTCCADGATRFGDERRTSIHEIPGHSHEQAMAVYEPAGRVEIPSIPAAVEKVLQDAFERARPALARVMPSITVCRPWTYVEYGEGQHITSHLDGIAPDLLAWPRQIAGISVVITQADAGGDFYVETASSDRLWYRQAPDAAANGYAKGMWLATTARTTPLPGSSRSPHPLVRRPRSGHRAAVRLPARPRHPPGHRRAVREVHQLARRRGPEELTPVLVALEGLPGAERAPCETESSPTPASEVSRSTTPASAPGSPWRPPAPWCGCGPECQPTTRRKLSKRPAGTSPSTPASTSPLPSPGARSSPTGSACPPPACSPWSTSARSPNTSSASPTSTGPARS